MKFGRLISFVMCCVLTAACFGGCSRQVSYKDGVEPYIRTMDYRDGFTVLQLTDIHWNGATQTGNAEYGSERYIRKVIAEAVEHAGQVDLIEITGDTFMLANKRAVRSFIDMLEDIGIPYAIVWGNHDRESKYNPAWISKQFLRAEHSLYTEVDNDDVHLRSNYAINLMDGSNVRWQLIQLDSGASYRNGASDLGLTYDYMRDDQFEWMGAVHKAAGADVPVICYYHIAQAEDRTVWDEIQNGSTEYKSKFFRLEGFGASRYAPDTRKIFAANNVKAAFLGHDHSNDWTFTTPDGITYGFGVKTGTELYSAHVTKDYKGSGVRIEEDFDLIGGSLVTLEDTSGSFKLEHLYLNERDEGDFVMWVEY